MITKGSALEIPRRTDDVWNGCWDFKGGALGYETGGAPTLLV